MENDFASQKRVAIISELEETADFFALEARVWGWSADVFSVAHVDLVGYDMVILDTASDGSAEQTHGRVIRLVYDEKDVTDGDTWEMPVSLHCVRELFCGAEGMSEARERTDDRRTVYIEDGDPRHIIYNNKRIDLTEREALVFSALTEGKGMTRRSELESLFGDSEGNSCDVYICHLRKKLESPFGIKLISTVRGEGYLFLGDVKNKKIIKVRRKYYDKSSCME